MGSVSEDTKDRVLNTLVSRLNDSDLSFESVELSDLEMCDLYVESEQLFDESEVESMVESTGPFLYAGSEYDLVATVIGQNHLQYRIDIVVHSV